MCTVSFIPTGVGFLLAMNRDEKRRRIAALPPAAFKLGDRRALYPREPDGGTWLAVNDAGLCLTLVNWHCIEREPRGIIGSRGRIIPELIAAADSLSVTRQVQAMSLQRLRPFRLVVIDSGKHRVTELRWDLKNLTERRHGWETRHWFSSGYNERKAERERTEVCLKWPLGTKARLRQLHASHLPRRGPFSICMHRRDAVTVSYSEVGITEKRVTLRYKSGAPCQAGMAVSRSMTLRL